MLEFMLLKGAFPARSGKKIKVLNPYIFFPILEERLKLEVCC